MAVTLLGVSKDLCLPQAQWVNMLSLARHFGWEPQGARPRRDLGFSDEGYEFSAYQQVADEDAKAFSDALERARSEFVRRGWDEADESEVETCDIPVPATFGLRYTHSHPVPQDDFAMCSKKMLAAMCQRMDALIALCRESGFVIS